MHTSSQSFEDLIQRRLCKRNSIFCFNFLALCFLRLTRSETTFFLLCVWDFPHYVIACELYLFVAESEAFVTWFLLGVKTGFGIPVSGITVMTLLFIGCCFMTHFDLVLRLGGSPRPKVLVLETLAAKFIFDVPFIIRWVNNICFPYMREILG